MTERITRGHAICCSSNPVLITVIAPQVYGLSTFKLPIPADHESTFQSWVQPELWSHNRGSFFVTLFVKSRHPIQWNHSQWLDHSDGVPKYRVLFVRMESEGKSRWNWVTSHSCFMILVFERSSYRALRRWSLVGERRGESSVFTQWRREMLNSEYFACDMNTYRRIRRFSSEYA